MTVLRPLEAPTGLHHGDHECWTFTGAEAREVVLDLSQLDFLDLAGARTPARAVASPAAAGVRLRLAGARRTAARCLELFGLPTEDALPT